MFLGITIPVSFSEACPHQIRWISRDSLNGLCPPTPTNYFGKYVANFSKILWPTFLSSSFDTKKSTTICFELAIIPQPPQIVPPEVLRKILPIWQIGPSLICGQSLKQACLYQTWDLLQPKYDIDNLFISKQIAGSRIQIYYGKASFSPDLTG